MSEIVIEQVMSVNDELVEATQRLMPLLGSSNQISVTSDYLDRVVANTANVWLIAQSTETQRIIGMAVLVVFELPTNARALLENVLSVMMNKEKGWVEHS
jgi:hypothetical protein